jgi:serine/threonine protein phosphatase PrpC
MHVHSVSLKGRREQNEDKHNIILNGNNKDPNLAKVNFFGVYDGHGGKSISKCLSKCISGYFMDKRVQYPLSESYVKSTYDHVQNTFRTKYKKIASYCGSTCLIAIHYKKDNNEYVNVLNTGDSRCVLCRDNLAIALTKDHKPNWPEEKNRIEKLNGVIKFDGEDYRIKDLSVSRAFGDIDAEPYVTHLPDIYTYKLNNTDKFLILACDGLWDVLSNQDVVNFILTHAYDDITHKRIATPDNIAKKLAEYAILKKGTGDNVSILIVFFKDK